MKQDEFYNDFGLFRFSLIAPAINHTHNFKTNNEYFKDISSKPHFFDGKEYYFSLSTIKSWYLKYTKYGYTSLNKKTRSDFKQSRKLNNETVQKIASLRLEYPSISGTAIYKKLIDEAYITKNEVSLNTVLRYIKSNNLKAINVSLSHRKMFEMENVNDCWQADTSDGPYIIIDNKKYRTKLIMFIDDKSRLITGFDFFLNDNAINMQSVFKNAIKTYGKPKKLFVDNGASYDNKQLSLICASLGIELIHTKPYTPEAKAKIERSFRTIKDGWMRCTNWNCFKSLNEVRDSLMKYIYNDYLNKKHSSTLETPNERWHNEYKNITFLDNEFIDRCFLHRKERKVRLDRTIRLEKKYYEVPFKYVSKTIELRYDPLDLKEVYIFENEEKKDICKPVDKIANSKVRRKESIDYSKVINDERYVIERKE